jgi:hypothetical protein
MGLPIQKAPKFKCKLSDGTTVNFRPFLVKEQKYLIIAKESTDNEEILDAVKNLINAVTDGEVDAEKLPIYDLEYLFLNIRAKSVGESVEVALFCQEPDCDGSGRTNVNLTEVEIVQNKEVDSKHMISEETGVTLRYPTTKQLAKVDGIKDEGDKIIELLKFGIETIFDGEDIYYADDISDSELVEFIESLTLDQLESLNEFYESIPSVSKEVSYKCDSCGVVNNTVLKGLSNFF